MMNMQQYLRSTFLFILFLLSFSSFAQQNSLHPYIENRGQWDDDILYKVKLNAGAMFLEQTSVLFNLLKPEDFDRKFHPHEFQEKYDPNLNHTNDKLHYHAYRVNYLNANPDAFVNPDEASASYENYFVGSDPEKWASNVSLYSNVMYENIYDGIDLEWSQQDENLKYTFLVDPNADASEIKMKYDGVDDLFITEGRLHVVTSVNEVIELEPFAYQTINNLKTKVSCEYSINGNVVTFIFPEDYDHSKKLIIDPQLIFGSFTGSTADNFGFTATYDTTGHLYGGGIVFGIGYPVVLDSYDTTFNGGGVDISISKFEVDGSSLIYSTYVGGNSDEQPSSLVVNESDQLVILGSTSSNDYPVSATAFDLNFNGGTSVSFPSNGVYMNNGSDIIVTVLNAGGTALVGSTYVGGSQNDGINNAANLYFNYGDQFRGEVIVDDSNNIYVASCSQSNDFPTTLGVYQPAINGSQDAVVFKLNNDCSQMIWGTFLGGSSADAAYSLKLDASGDIYFTGGTTSQDFPTTFGALNTNNQGGITDGFLSELNNSGTALTASTYIGTSLYDQSFFVDIDDPGDIYITGQSLGSYPTTGGVYFNAGGKQFIHKLNPALTTTLYSTVFGSGGNLINISPTAFLVDVCQNVYVSGWGGSVNQNAPGAGSLGNTSSMAISGGAFQSTTDGSDFYYIVLSANATSLAYSTYFGGNAAVEHVDGGTSRFDEAGIVYQAVCAGCGGNSSFPTTPGAWSQTNNSSNCNLGVMKFQFDLGVTSVNVSASGTSGCAPLNVAFTGNGNALTYYWDFGDGATSDQANPSHVFLNPGTYTVMLIGSDTTSLCVIAQHDTAYITVEVCTCPLSDFDPDGSGCAPLDVSFTNNSQGTNQFVWDFGDGATSSALNPIHTYLTAGTYIIELTAIDTSCNTDVLSYDTVVVDPGPTADFSSDMIMYQIGDSTVFTNLSDSATTYLWDYGDGTTSNVFQEYHLYINPGEYLVCLTSTNDAGCIDSLCKIIIVVGEHAIDIPNAFSPNGDGKNEFLFVRGYGIETMNLKIFDRWGRLMFETNDLAIGWDGYYKGKLQEMEVYVYYLTATFKDVAEKYEKKGNITLVR